eukprot:Blabericola_migrator_1__6333@NODE_3197_length_1955_cov_8_902542_g2000_i0_p1_GENE_NODE_3197_length_1955_cov_8_902542_g2000_i0NODE_3197_length_1955_cov_8_902542_g2000_i0_p1_ORF_typecomplete_len205_score15_25SUIM_assoc/PF16619_5/0_0017AAA_PrkA/PF08298_11/0_03TniB/PF05621_11/0_072AAA_16/PF13191_6/8_9e02AAA_16/PF13191_6/0_26_NODE_3197_length_1955_cov_8_902542_g2000_i06341248
MQQTPGTSHTSKLTAELIAQKRAAFEKQIADQREAFEKQEAKQLANILGKAADNKVADERINGCSTEVRRVAFESVTGGATMPLNALYEHLRWVGREGKVQHQCVAFCQSSGCGKSRTVRELAQRYYVCYLPFSDKRGVLCEHRGYGRSLPHFHCVSLLFYMCFVLNPLVWCKIILSYGKYVNNVLFISQCPVSHTLNLPIPTG